MSAELEKAKSNLEKAEKLQEIMKKANAIIRAGKDVTNKLVGIGMSQDQAVKIQEKDFAGRIGFAQYQLTNNNATIKRLKDRVNQLESKETAATAGEERYLFEGGSVEVNYTDDRVQILYDAIPTKEQRDQLKSNGWKWSPKNTAWQRKITPQAISNAKYITGATGSAPVQEQTGPIDTDELLKKRKFSYVTVNLYGALPVEYTGDKTFEFVYFDVISANIVEAVRAYFKENLPEIAAEKIKVSVYTKTYVKESQRLVDQNRFLPNDAPAKIVLGPGLQRIKDFLSAKPEPEATPEPEPETVVEEVFEPNTGDEFDEMIISNLQPHDGWVGNIIKERIVRKQIYDQLTGPESEKDAAVSRIFEKYKAETVANPPQSDGEPKEDFIRDHFVFATVPPIGPKFKTFEQHGETFAKNHIAKAQDGEILSRYPKLSKTEIVNVYNQVEAILGKEEYTAEDKYILEKYEGLGSQTATGIIDKGLLHQFYTPYIIAKKMWELGFIYGVPTENPIVIEPSMGTGRFFKYAPAGSTCIGFDPDKKNVEIAKILYPDITVYQQEFETAFLEAPRYNRMAKKSWLPEADLCIGNPPYGDYMGYYKSYMPSAFKRFEFLFIYLGLKTLKPGGLLVFIVSQNFMNNGAMYNGMKAKILEIGTFVDSIRLPNGIFSSTDVGTDIVIFRKK